MEQRLDVVVVRRADLDPHAGQARTDGTYRPGNLR